MSQQWYVRERASGLQVGMAKKLTQIIIDSSSSSSSDSSSSDDTGSESSSDSSEEKNSASNLVPGFNALLASGAVLLAGATL